MGRIIQFDDYRRSDRYKKLVGDLMEYLENDRIKLIEFALNLASAGEWREWDARQAPGTSLLPDPDDLERTDDALVKSLMAMDDRLDEALALCAELLPPDGDPVDGQTE